MGGIEVDQADLFIYVNIQERADAKKKFWCGFRTIGIMRMKIPSSGPQASDGPAG